MKSDMSDELVKSMVDAERAALLKLVRKDLSAISKETADKFARVLARRARPLGATKPGVTARCSARGGGGSCRRGRARAPRRGGT